MEENADTYLTLEGTAEGLYKEKGSRFMAFGYPVDSPEEALEKVKAVRDRYHDARHHCWAYRIGKDGETYRVNDDGEPSGTAGRPIHGMMTSSNITNVVFVVVRYFGGIKLGTSGLIEAYRAAVKDAIQSANIVEKKVMKRISFSFPYEQIGRVMKLIKKSGAKIVTTDMNDPCNMEIEIRAGEYDSVERELKEIKI